MGDRAHTSEYTQSVW